MTNKHEKPKLQEWFIDMVIYSGINKQFERVDITYIPGERPAHSVPL